MAVSLLCLQNCLARLTGNANAILKKLRKHDRHGINMLQHTEDHICVYNSDRIVLN